MLVILRAKIKIKIVRKLGDLSGMVFIPSFMKIPVSSEIISGDKHTDM